MALSLPVPDRALTLRDEVDRAGGELTMSVQTVLDLFADGDADANGRRRARQGLAEQQLACEPDLVQAGPEGFVTIFSRKPMPMVDRLPAREVGRAASEAVHPQPARKRTTAARVASFVALALAVLAGAVFAAWSLGRDTRLSDAQVTTKVERALDQRGKQAAADQAEAVRSAKAAQKAKDAKSARKHLKEVVAKTRKSSYDRGYAAGNSNGYAAGNSAGYSAGNADGVEEGVEKASDELVCSDDSDVDLPACFF